MRASQVHSTRLRRPNDVRIERLSPATQSTMEHPLGITRGLGVKILLEKSLVAVWMVSSDSADVQPFAPSRTAMSHLRSALS